jgi:hypothetical protein
MKNKSECVDRFGAVRRDITRNSGDLLDSYLEGSFRWKNRCMPNQSWYWYNICWERKYYFELLPRGCQEIKNNNKDIYEKK